MSLSTAPRPSFRRVDLCSNSDSLVIELDIAKSGDGLVQWFRGNELLRGQTSRFLYLRDMIPDDSDCYYAELQTKNELFHSETLLVSVQARPQPISFSCRGVADHANELILGFVVTHISGPCESASIIVRIGSAHLQAFGISSTVEEVSFSVMSGNRTINASFVPQSKFCKDTLKRIGVSHTEGPGEPVIARLLLPYGPYTIHARPATASSGQVMVEVFTDSADQ